jgi:Rap1a immunity proteins
MKSAALALLLAAALHTAPAHADESTPLIELCAQFVALPKVVEVTADYIQLKSSCAGFINSHVKMSKPEDGFCVPKGYNMDDLARHYMEWIKKNPGREKDPTKVTMTEALTQVYPCPK